MANDLDALFQSAAAQYGLDPNILRAMSAVESGTNPNVRNSPQGAVGIMQMLPATAASMGAADPSDPTQAIPAAARYLREGLDKTGSLEGAVSYYHGGPNVRLWGPKTADYLRKVSGAYNSLSSNAQDAISTATRQPARSVSVDEALAYAPTPSQKAPAMAQNAKGGSPDIMDLYFGNAAQGAPQAGSGASSALAKPVDVMELYLGGGANAAPAPKAVPSDAQPGPNGLVWNSQGGFDPKTGELVVAGRPMTDQTASPMSAVRSGVAGFVEGLPVVGPLAQAGVERGAAAYRALAGDRPYSEALRDVQAGREQDVSAHPTANTVGQVAGGVVGTLPMVAAAPAAFGIGEASLPVRAGISALTNAGIGGTDAAIRSGGDPRAIGTGAAVGGTMGFAGPLVGAGISAGGNALMDAARGISGPAKTINRLMGAVGMTPADASARLARLGPEATLADIDPALTTEAGALAARGGATTSTLKGAMQARAAGADDRATQLVNQHLGAKPDLNTSLEAIQNDAATRAGPLYAAGRQGPPMDVTPVLADIDRRLPNASGGAESVLNRVRSFLTDKVASANNPVGLDVPKSDPAAIHGARQALDDMISKMGLDTSAGRNAQRVAMDLRDQIDNVVKSNPHFAAGDAIYEQSMGLRDAMRDGTEVFTRNMRPEDLQRTVSSMTPEQGARVAIGDAMEQSRRGDLAGAQSMFARGSANRAKLDAIFPGAQDALDALHSEATMRGTERQLLSQSVTAERQAAMQRWNPTSGGGMPGADLLAMAQGAALGDPSGGVATAAARRGGSAVLNYLRQAASENAARGTARAMVATGPEQQALLDQLTRAGNPLLGAGTNAGVNLLMQAGAPQIRNKLTGTW